MIINLPITPSLENLVKEIHTINQSWKLTVKILQRNQFLSEDKIISTNDDYHSHKLAQSLRDLKVKLQLKLLKNFAPNLVYLIEDKETLSDEPLYSLKLVDRVNNYQDAAHLPIRVAQQYLSAEEIKTFSK